MHFCFCHMNIIQTHKRDIAANNKKKIFEVNVKNPLIQDEYYILVTEISIYVKNITQTLHAEWRFNENSFVKLLLKQFHFYSFKLELYENGVFFCHIFFPLWFERTKIKYKGEIFIHDRSIIILCGSKRKKKLRFKVWKISKKWDCITMNNL